MSQPGSYSIPLIQTKLQHPIVPINLVQRPNLIAQLNDGLSAGSKLTLVSAPAGYGKTALLNEWLRKLDQPFAWLTLDASDNDLARFFDYLLAALQQAYPNIGKTAQILLQDPQPSSRELILTSLINELTEMPYLCVLDDYHLIEESGIHEAVVFLLDHMPSQMHLVIATRADPPLPVARLRARGQLTELHADDLRFKPNEVQAFLNELMGLDLNNEQVAALDQRTEGWIAGAIHSNPPEWNA